jgi:hypothetical protein
MRRAFIWRRFVWPLEPGAVGTQRKCVIVHIAVGRPAGSLRMTRRVILRRVILRRVILRQVILRAGRFQ